MSVEHDFTSATELARLVSAKAASPVEVTRRALDRAQATQSTLNAFFLLMEDDAMAAARSAEAAVMRSEALGPLHRTLRP